MNNSDQKFMAQKIRAAYTEKQSTELDELRALDKKAKRPADILAYVTGGIGALVLGTGMSMVMTVSGMMAPGIAVGIVGLLITALNYPAYKHFLKARRAKYADEILTLSQKIIENPQD